MTTSTYAVAVTRVTYYRIDAETFDEAESRVIEEGQGVVTSIEVLEIASECVADATEVR